MTEWWGPIAGVAIASAIFGFVLGQISGGFLNKLGADLWDALRRRMNPEPGPPPEPIYVAGMDTNRLRSHPDIGQFLPADLGDLVWQHLDRMRTAEAEGHCTFRATGERDVRVQHVDSRGSGQSILMWKPEKGPAK